MELAKEANLVTRLKRGDYKGKEKQQAMKDVGNQLLNGFAYMHSKKIAHGDLFEGNVAFQGDQVKIIDLDRACQDKSCVNWTPDGDFGYASPGQSYHTSFKA